MKNESSRTLVDSRQGAPPTGYRPAGTSVIPGGGRILLGGTSRHTTAPTTVQASAREGRRGGGAVSAATNARALAGRSAGTFAKPWTIARSS